MIELRHFPTQRAINQQLPKGGEKQIRAAHDFTDLHRCVIRNYRQLIGRHIVFPPNDEITEIQAGIRGLRSKTLVDELHRFPARHTKTPIMSRGRIKVADRCTPWPAGPWVNRLLVFMVRRGGGLKDVTPRAGAGIKQPRLSQVLPGGQIVFAPFTLRVRRKRSAHVQSFIPAQSKPMKILDDGVAILPSASVFIQVLDSENKFSGGLTGAFLRTPKRYRVPDVKITRRRWGDATAIRNFRFQIADFRLA